MLETDAPDIPPQWLYSGLAEQRAVGARSRNEPVLSCRASPRRWPRLVRLDLAETALSPAPTHAAFCPKLAPC